MGTVRCNTPVVVRHPDLPGQMVPLVPDKPYDSDDILVLAYPWAFAPDDVEDATAKAAPTAETATAEPGEKRRAGKPKDDPAPADVPAE